MRLQVEVSGQGKPLIMLHGWGMHCGIFAEIAARLAENFAVHNVDLPGYGNCTLRHSASRLGELSWGSKVQALLDELVARNNGPVHVLGWSLGGIIAQQWAARAPQQIERLILVATTPCFTQRADWPFGMARETLQAFAAELEKHPATTLRRFLALQVRGSERERELLATLRAQLFCRGEPERAALREGLNILRDVDLRKAACTLPQPTLLIAGQRDQLIPPAASRYLAQVIPNAKVVEIAGAAHVPFLSHPEFFVEQVERFLNEPQNCS